MPAARSSRSTSRTGKTTGSSRVGERAREQDAAPAGPDTDEHDEELVEELDADGLDGDDLHEDEDVEEVEVSPELIFTTSKKERDPADEEKIPFELDGEIYYSLKPTDEALIFLTTAASRGLSDGDRFNALLQFCDNAMDHESSNRITARFLDRADDFWFDDLLKLAQTLAKTWGRRKGGKTQARRGAARGRPTGRGKRR